MVSAENLGRGGCPLAIAALRLNSVLGGRRVGGKGCGLLWGGGRLPPPEEREVGGCGGA